MKFFRAVFIGLIIWILGVSIFLLSYFIPVMKDLDFQANLVLSLAVIPLVWMGSWFYYTKEAKTHGLTVGAILFLTSALMDAFITVPYLMAPYGETHYSFFTAPCFWLIAVEFVLTTVLFWNFIGKSSNQKTINSK
ncbi:DUF5367 family protein [Muricauda sp. CAU 1633]|uniref:DUF5367 family protein n=1 Tax=Allomuricauda sp. CAU 1633 TaxID=2816036 RepID=UPI001A90BD7F|nr:DUF5367 family protein [Muricauda sp. CAU 1633]MBO0321603.1 DUF5367 family protein [Muricauda sp. CAU 1633]